MMNFNQACRDSHPSNNRHSSKFCANQQIDREKKKKSLITSPLRHGPDWTRHFKLHYSAHGTSRPFVPSAVTKGREREEGTGDGGGKPRDVQALPPKKNYQDISIVSTAGQGNKFTLQPSLHVLENTTSQPQLGKKSRYKVETAQNWFSIRDK